MPNRALRSRTVEINPEDSDLPAGERDYADRQSEGLGSDLVLEGGLSNAQRDTPTEVSMSEQREGVTTGIAVTEAPNLRDLFTGMLAAMQESNKALQSSAESKISSLQENSKALQTSIEAKISGLQENSNKLQASVEAKLNQLEQSNVKLQEKVRADIRSENVKLIERFEAENKKLSNAFSER
jgi:t-SNARE complex subunit (syntaxin)